MAAGDPRSDQELVAAANSGDPTAFEALYRRYRDHVLRLALRFTAHEEDALDVLHETFTYLLRKFPGFRLKARLTTFLYPVVRHLAADARRKRRRFRSDEEALAAAAAREENPRRSEEREALARVVDRLPESQREVLLMRFADDMSLEEISRALGIPLGTVKSRLHNALERLREDPWTRRYFGLS